MEPKIPAPEIRVMIADDHHLVRQSIRLQIDTQEDMRVIAEAEDGESLFAGVKAEQPDVLLLDINMPAERGRRFPPFRLFPGIARVQRLSPRTHIIILTQSDDYAILEGAIQHGVRGYVLKSDDLSLHLPVAVRSVQRAGVYFSESIGPQILSRRSQMATLTLTQRQEEVLRAIARYPNRTYAELAAFLNISESTFKTHLSRLFKQLEVGNATAAIIRAIQVGLLPLEIVYGSDS